MVENVFTRIKYVRTPQSFLLYSICENFPKNPHAAESHKLIYSTNKQKTTLKIIDFG